MTNPRLWKAQSGCDESQVNALAVEFSASIRCGDRVILEGPMGAGKSTFARSVIQALGVSQPPEGSPTFAIAHEYLSPRGEIAHLDLYRLKSAQEIEDAGIPSYFWERRLVVLVEWLSLHPELERSVLTGMPGLTTWRINLGFSGGDSVRRNVEIRRSDD